MAKKHDHLLGDISLHVMRRILELEVEKRKFAIQYPRLMKFFKSYAVQLEAELEQFLIDQQHNKSTREEKQLQARQIMTDLRLMDSCLNYVQFPCPTQNVSKRRIQMNNLNFDHFMYFLENLRKEFQGKLLNKFSLIFVPEIKKIFTHYTIADLVSNNNLVELICDYWRLEAILENRNEVENHTAVLSQDNFQYCSNALKALNNYRTSFSSSIVSSFIEHSQLEMHGYLQDYVSLNVKCFEDGTNIPNLLTNFLLVYLNEKVLFAKENKEISSALIDKTNEDLGMIYSIIEKLDSVQNKQTSFSSSSTFISGLLSLLCFDTSKTDISFDDARCARDTSTLVKQAAEKQKAGLDTFDPQYHAKRQFVSRKTSELNDENIRVNFGNFNKKHFLNLTPHSHL